MDTARGGMAGLAPPGFKDTLHFSDCLLLSGHPNALMARAYLATTARARADAKSRRQ
jgi:hypothetical protein